MIASAMYAVCPVHGRVSVAGQIAIKGGAWASFINCAVSCPICGRPARIPSGSYDRIASVFDVLRGPTVTTGQVRELREVLETAPQRPVADTVAAARSINAAFGALFTDEASNRVFTTILALLALFFSFYEAATDSSGRERTEASRRAHDDAVSMRDALDRHAGLLEQIRNEVAQRSPEPPAATPSSVPSPAVAIGSTVRARSPNRQQRRTAEARARKGRRGESITR